MKITDIEVNESIELGDNFDIELGNTIIESRVVGFMDDGVILEADDKALALLGISGALLESVDITEVSLGDYSKKAQISRALAQIDQKFYPDKPGSEQTIAKRTRGLERAKVRNDQARAKYAAQAQQDRAKAIAKDRENLPTLEKYLAQLQSEFDPYYEYSDDHSVWTKNRELKAKISDLERRIKDAKNITESKSFGPENPYEVKPGEDFSLVFKPGKQSGVHYHMNSGMVADPFYFILNGKLYSVTNQGDGIPKEVQQGVAEGTNVTDYNPKSQGGTRKELLAKYHNTKDPKDAEAARKAGATQKELRGVAEGYDNVGNKIKALYQKIYDQGDDSIDYMYHESPVFAQIWDEYEGDLDSIIAEVDPSELQVIANELEAYLQGPGLTEVYAPAVGGKDFDQYTPAVDAAMKKHNAEKALYKAANPKDDPTGALQQKGFDRAQAVGQRLATKQALGKVNEGRMKEQMHTDAERMELAAFLDKYGNEEWVKEFWQNVNDDINEAKYQGREVPLGKPMAGDVKKSKVYVRGPKGNVVKVNFGDKNMRIKKSNPKRRKSFRARHNCANPGPRWKARYWSCRAW